MRTKRMSVVAASVVALAAATAWGLSISVLLSGPAVDRSELPNAGFERTHGAGETVLRAAYGDGTGEVGIEYLGEARGPSSFAVDDRERIYVLDPVNHRVARYANGRFDVAFELPDGDFEDIVVARDRFAVLSRIEDRRVLVFDAEHGFVATLPVAPAVPGVYRLFVSGGDVVVECPGPANRTYHTIGTLDGLPSPAEQQSIPRPGGTPLLTGDTLSAAKITDNDIAVDVLGRDRSAGARLRAHSDRTVSAILDATGDQRGNIYVTWALVSESPTVAASSAKGRLVVARYSPDGELTGRLETRDDYTPEPFRKIVVTASGQVYQLAPEKSGVRVLRWTLQP